LNAFHFPFKKILGKNVAFIKNLKPRKLRGVLSEGMILAAQAEETKYVSLLHVSPNIPSGSVVS